MADLSKGVNLNNTLAAQVKPTDEQLLDELYGTTSKPTMTDAGVKKYIGPMPKKEPGIVDTAKDIGKGIVRGPFENLKNTAVNLSKYLGIEGTPQELAPFSTDVLEMIGKPSTDAGKIAETISQVGTAVLTTRNIPGATTFTGSMATGAISDFVIWDSNDGRLADLLSEAGVQNELVKYLKHDPKDSAMEDNFKNVVEGALSNVVAEGVIRTTIAGYKAAKASLWASRTPEEVAVAIENAAVKPIVPKAKKVVTPKAAPDAVIKSDGSVEANIEVTAQAQKNITGNNVNKALFKEAPEEAMFKEVLNDPTYFMNKKDGLQVKIVNMTPDEYMQTVEQFQKGHKSRDSSVESLKKAFQEGTSVSMPWLSFGERDAKKAAFGQEGYNRAYTAKELGDTTIPVAIRYREDDKKIPAFIKKYLEKDVATEVTTAIPDATFNILKKEQNEAVNSYVQRILDNNNVSKDDKSLFWKMTSNYNSAEEALPKFKKYMETKSLRTAEDFADTGTMYHGTSSKIVDFNEYHTTDTNIYGDGFYSTSKPSVASSYTKKGKGKESIVYKVEEVNEIKALDMETTLADKDMFDGYVDITDGMTLREALDEFRANSKANGMTKYEVTDFIDSIQKEYEAQGYNAWTHKGGTLTGGEGHFVKIYFNPKKDIKLIDVSDSIKIPDTMVAKTPDVTGIKPPSTAFNYDKLGVGQQERNIIESITSNKDFEEYFKTGVKPLSVTEEEGKMLAATIGDDYLDFAKQLVQDTQDMDVKLVAIKKIMADKVTTISERLAVSDGTDKEGLLKNLLDVQDIYTLVGGAKSVQVAGARTTSAGRIGINVADMMAKIDEARAVAPELLDRELDKFIDDITATKMHKILQDLVDVESEVTLKKAVSMLDSNDGVLTKLANVLVESRTAGILSSPVTLGVNLVGNSSVVALRTIEYYMAGIIGKLSGSLDRFTMEELNAMSTGMLTSTKGTFRGLWNAVKGLKGGAKNFEDVLEESYLDSFKKYDTGSYRAISQDYLLGGTAEAGVIKQGLGGLLDAAGAVIRLPYHALGVTDDMFKRSIYNGQISYIGTREANKLGLTGNARNKFIGEFLASHQALFMNPKTELTPEMKDLVAKYIQDNNGKYHLEALERAREYTFQEEIRAGDADSKINKTLHWIDKARTASPYGQFIVPFFITPVNILKWVGRRTPGVHLLSQRMTSDILAGGRRKALAQAKLTMGVSLYTMGGLLAYNNMITGTAPEKEREAWKTAGIPEHSVKIGDKWVQYNRLDPIGMFLGIMADINQFHQDMVRRGYDNMEGYYDHMNEVAGATITSFTNNVMSKTWLKSIDDLLNAIDNKDATYLSAMASSLAPYTGAARWYNDVEYQKEARDIFEQFKKAYAPDELRDALDIFGKPIKVDTIYGVKQSSVSNSVVRKEIMRLKLGVDKFSNKIIMGGTQVELEPVDHWKLQSYINNMKIDYKDGKSYILEDLLNKVVTSPEYQQAPDGIDFTIEGTKKYLIHSSISNAREAARAKLLKDNPAILKKYMDKRTENINTLGNKRRGLYENWLTPTSDTQQQQLLDVGKIK